MPSSANDLAGEPGLFDDLVAGAALDHRLRRKLLMTGADEKPRGLFSEPSVELEWNRDYFGAFEVATFTQKRELFCVGILEDAA